MRQNKDRASFTSDTKTVDTWSATWRAENPRKVGSRMVREPRLEIKPERPSKSEEFGLN